MTVRRCDASPIQPPGVQVGQLWGSNRKGEEHRIVEIIELHTGRSPLSRDGNYRVTVRRHTGREGVLRIKTLWKGYDYLRHASDDVWLSEGGDGTHAILLDASDFEEAK